MFMVANEAAGPHSFTFEKTSSPRNLQAQVDNESVRGKLRDSLTSALEMVVSKQLVKSVLGVVKDFEEAVEDENLSLQVQFNTLDKVTADRSIEDEVGTRISDGEVLRLKKVPDINQSVSLDGEIKVRYDSKPLFEVHESVAKKLKSKREERGSIAEATKGGLELMERAKKLAWNVELHLFSLNGGVNKKYKEKARSLLFNLKDKSNPELRARVFNEEITAEILVRMTAAQLASKKLSQWRTAKAEEFASMVVLTDADVDPRRIVKKTHKGEFQVVVEEIDASPGAENIISRQAFPANVVVEGFEGKIAESIAGRIGKGILRSKDSIDLLFNHGEGCGKRESESSCSHGRLGNGSIGREELGDDFNKDLSTIMSLDEYVDNRHEAGSERAEEHFCAEAFLVDKTLGTVDLTPAESKWAKALAFPLRHSPIIGTPKINNIPSSMIPDSRSPNGACYITEKERDNGFAVWNGSIQISGTRLAPINGFYRSGERLELKDWPNLIEVKGRVRLGALDKFLQDLQISRSRTVTILSLCLTDCHGNMKQMAVYLKEMADQYRLGERAGFLEPKPGFELYLLAPGSASVDLLSEDLKSIKGTRERENEVFVGVVVWRKSQSQGLSSSRGPDQNISERKNVLANLVSDSHTKVDARPLDCTEASSSRRALSASLKTASGSSLVIASGNSSMHSTATCDPPILLDWQKPHPVACGLQLPPIVSPMNGIEENTVAVVDSCPLSHPSVKDVPPGFLPQSTELLPFARSSTLNANSEQYAGGFQAPPFIGSGSCQVSMVQDVSRAVSKDLPPGFWPKSSVKAPTAVCHRTFLAPQEDDDDLPEFNFEVEGVTPNANASQETPIQAQFVAHQVPNFVLGSFTGLHRTNDSNIGHHHNVRDRHSPSMLFQPSHNGFPKKHGSQQEEPFSTLSVTSNDTDEGWDLGDVACVETPCMHCDVSMPMLPLNAIDHQSQSLRVPREEVAQQFGKFGHDHQRVLGTVNPMPSCFTRTLAPFLNSAHNTALNIKSIPRHDLPEWCPRTLVSQSRWPSLPLILQNLPLHIGQYLPLPHMVVQQHTMTKDSTLTWPRDAPLPHQEARQDQWHGMGMANPDSEAKWLQTNPVHCRSITPRRRFEKREGTESEGTTENNAKDMRFGRDRTRVRERSRELSLSPSREKALEERWGSENHTKTKGKHQAHGKDVGVNIEARCKLKSYKPLKRERERDQ